MWRPTPTILVDKNKLLGRYLWVRQLLSWYRMEKVSIEPGRERLVSLRLLPGSESEN